MQLRLKTKITLTTAIAGSGRRGREFHAVRHESHAAGHPAGATIARNWFRRQVFFQAQNALADAAKAGEAPASDSPEDLRAYVQKAFDESAPLSSSIDAEVGYSPLIYEVSISDVQGTCWSPATIRCPAMPIPAGTKLAQLVSHGFVNS